MVLGVEMPKPYEIPAALVEQLLKAMEQMDRRPARIEVQRDEVAPVLEPVAERLGIRVRRVRRLAALNTVKRNLQSHLALR
jgi:hypothetical protein